MAFDINLSETVEEALKGVDTFISSAGYFVEHNGANKDINKERGITYANTIIEAA